MTTGRMSGRGKKGRDGRFSILAYSLILGILFISACCTPSVVGIQNLAPYTSAEARWVRKTLGRMTVEEKIGQMIAWRSNGRFFNLASDEIRSLVNLVARRKIGGLVVFAGEVYETAHLINHLQRQARIPLLVAADFEWGAAMRINGATLFPPLMALGATGSEELAAEMGRITAVEGRAMGIHMTYAPVVDVNINPANPVISARSLGEDPKSVGRLAGAFIKACQANGMIATAKHFPGHGDTDLDSHTLLPTIAADRDRLERVELDPFVQAIKAGVEAVMTGHLHVPALDPTPGLPATLSPPIVSDLLRQRLGFKGLIVTDSMGMGGITNSFTPQEAALRAVDAGADMILLPPEPEAVIEHLVRSVKTGRLREDRLDESVGRILALKARLGLQRMRYVDIGALAVKIATPENLRLAQQAFERAVTLVKNVGEILPLPGPASGLKIAVLSLSSDADDYYAGNVFIRELRKRHPGISAFYADAFTGREFLNQAREKALEADLVIFALFSSLRTAKGSVDLLPRHIDLVREMTWARKKTVALSFGSPYFLRHFPEVDAYLCFYRNTPQAQEVAARAVCGEIDITGRLPVSIPGLFPVGHGLSLKAR